MCQATKEVIFCLALVFAWSAVLGGVSAQITGLTGTLPDGATYLIEVPANWNGTLFLYSHGYVMPGAANPAQGVGDPSLARISGHLVACRRSARPAVSAAIGFRCLF